MTNPRLMRSESDRFFAGVCGGIAAYLGVESIFVRLAFLVLTFASGIGVLLYFILMIIMPSETTIEDEPSQVLKVNVENFGDDVASSLKQARRHPQGPTIAAGLLIALGVYLLLSNLGWISWLGAIFWPLVIIGLGVYLFRQRKR